MQREYDLARLLHSISTQELKLKAVQIVLVQLVNSDLRQIYEMIDKRGKENVQKQDLQAFFESIRFQCDQQDFQLIFERLDADKDGVISFNDFLRNLYIQEQCLTKQDKNMVGLLQQTICRFFQRRIESLRTIEKCKKFANFSAKEVSKIFKSISNSSDFIQMQQLQSFLLQYDMYVSQQDIRMIFFVTDINRDELISLNELIELIVPKIIYEKATISITVPQNQNLFSQSGFNQSKQVNFFNNQFIPSQSNLLNNSHISNADRLIQSNYQISQRTTQESILPNAYRSYNFTFQDEIANDNKLSLRVPSREVSRSNFYLLKTPYDKSY